MAQGVRPDRVGEQIRQELSLLLGREVQDPGIGLITITRVKLSPDLQVARAYYTLLGDEKDKRETQRALERAIPFLRRQLGQRIRLRRVPELTFSFDASVEYQDRIEQIILELNEERRAHEATLAATEGADAPDAAATTLPGEGTTAPAEAPAPNAPRKDETGQ